MRQSSAIATAIVAAAVVAGSAVAYADPEFPQVGTVCAPDLAGAMTLLTDGEAFVVCEAQPNAGFAWAPAAIPFPPNSVWLSYGPDITLHGEGLRNPNLSSGDWTATPQDPSTRCGAKQVTIVSAGVLAPPQFSEGEPGQPLSVRVLPKLFSITLTGNCLWVGAERGGQ